MSAAKDKENKKAAAAVATKDVVAAVPEKRKRGRKPKSSETSVAEGKPDTNAKENTPTETPNEAKNSKKNEKEEDAEQPAAKKTKTTKALKENAATTPTNESRPSRDRKTTEHYTYPKKEVKEPKKNSIPEGNGTPLRDIKSIHEEFSKAATDDDILRGFHGIVFGGRAAQKHIKSELLQFNGFNFASDKEHDAALGKLERFTMAGLKDLANLLCVESSGNKETVLERVWEFLKAPSKDAATNSRKRRRSSGAKKDDESDDDTEEGADKEKKVVKKAKSATTKLPSSKTVAASTAASPGTAKEGKKRGPKPKPKTPFEVYAREKRKDVETETKGSTEEVDKTLQERFDKLKDSEKKAYEAKLEELKTVKKKADKPAEGTSSEAQEPKKAAPKKKGAAAMSAEAATSSEAPAKEAKAAKAKKAPVAKAAKAKEDVAPAKKAADEAKDAKKADAAAAAKKAPKEPKAAKEATEPKAAKATKEAKEPKDAKDAVAKPAAKKAKKDVAAKPSSATETPTKAGSSKEALDPTPRREFANKKTPTNAQITKEMKKILSGADLSQVTSRSVRLKLEEIFDSDMSKKKEYVRIGIDEWLAEHQEATTAKAAKAAATKK